MVRIDFSAFLNPKVRSLLGLDISSTAVKLVELTADGKNNYRVERYAIEALPRDAVADGNIAHLDNVVDTVRRAWKRLGTTTKHVAMALPGAAVITKKIVVPAGLREEELEIQVESEANQYIPFAIDEVNLDYQVVGPAPGAPEDLEVLIAASKKERVEDRVAVADASGLKAIVMDVDNLAALSAFSLVQHQLPEAGRDQVIALIDMGANVLNLTVLKNGQQVYAREQAFGGHQLTQDISRHYGLTLDEAEIAKRNNDLPDGYENELLNPFLETLALEVSRALQFFFSSTQFNRVDHIVLSGGCALIHGVDEIVGQRTQIDTLIANPFAHMSLSERVRPKNLLADAPSLMVACGLALRRFDSK